MAKKKSHTEKKKKAFKAYNPGKNRRATGKKNSITKDLPEKLFPKPNHPYPSPPTQTDQMVGGYS